MAMVDDWQWLISLTIVDSVGNDWCHWQGWYQSLWLMLAVIWYFWQWPIPLTMTDSNGWRLWLISVAMADIIDNGWHDWLWLKSVAMIDISCNGRHDWQWSMLCIDIGWISSSAYFLCGAFDERIGWRCRKYNSWICSHDGSYLNTMVDIGGID